MSFHIDPENNKILKHIEPGTDKNPNEVKVCIAGQCYLLKKDPKGNYIWPGMPFPQPEPKKETPTPALVPKIKTKTVKTVTKVIAPPLPRKKLEHSTNFTFIFLRPMQSTNEKGIFEIKKLTK